MILIDCAPSLGLLTINALTAADKVIMPMECEFFALRGIALLTDTITKVQDRLNPDLEVLGILGTMYDPRTLHTREVMERVVDAFGDVVFHSVIRRTIKFPETTVAGEPITTYASNSPGAASYRTAGQGGPAAVSRRVKLPGASELFRPTGTETSGAARAAGPTGTRRTVRTGRRTVPRPTEQDDAGSAAGGGSGRVRHEEKITVYVSRDELLAIEQARLRLRGELGLAVDRGRLVRAAMALALADLEAAGSDGELVRRLTAS